MRRLSSPMKAWPGVPMAPKVLMGRTTKRIRVGRAPSILVLNRTLHVNNNNNNNYTQHNQRQLVDNNNNIIPNQEPETAKTGLARGQGPTLWYTAT